MRRSGNPQRKRRTRDGRLDVETLAFVRAVAAEDVRRGTWRTWDGKAQVMKVYLRARELAERNTAAKDGGSLAAALAREIPNDPVERVSE